jgi:hypothetical protein
MNPHQTIYARSVLLTANFYKEYLGFKEISRIDDKESPMVWLSLEGQILLIIPMNSEHELQGRLEFWIDEIDDYFCDVRQKVRIKRSLALSSYDNWQFAYFDCEGNSITISGKTSPNVSWTSPIDEDLLKTCPI